MLLILHGEPCLRLNSPVCMPGNVSMALHCTMVGSRAWLTRDVTPGGDVRARDPGLWAH